jgi:hypothetical protein
MAGPVGSAAAYMTGFYDDQPEAVACDAQSIWDIVPGALADLDSIVLVTAVGPPPRARLPRCSRQFCVERQLPWLLGPSSERELTERCECPDYH